jgi:hypothetical protein
MPGCADLKEEVIGGLFAVSGRNMGWSPRLLASVLVYMGVVGTARGRTTGIDRASPEAELWASSR